MDVGDVSNDFLQQVFHRDQTDRFVVVVNDDRDLSPLFPHLIYNLVCPGRAFHSEGRTHPVLHREADFVDGVCR